MINGLSEPFHLSQELGGLHGDSLSVSSLIKVLNSEGTQHGPFSQLVYDSTV